MVITIGLLVLPRYVRAAQDQTNEFGNAPERITKKILGSKALPKKVLVCDFFGPDDRLTELGLKLADAFSQNLTTNGGSLILVDRSDFVDELHALGLERQLNACDIAANRLSAPNYVSGDISIKGEKIVLALELFMRGWDVPVDKMKVEIGFEQAAKSLLAADVEEVPQSPYPPAGLPASRSHAVITAQMLSIPTLL